MTEGMDAHTQSSASPPGRATGHSPPESPVAPPPPFLTASEICTVAAKLVGGARQVNHGDKSINFANTADVWNALLRAKARQAGWPVETAVFVTLDALDVANMLELFKVARRYSGKHNPDDYIDGAGYAGCAGEVASAINHHPRNHRGEEPL